VLHSYLYVPADRPDLMEKAVRGAAHAVILDLEDGVAPTMRVEAHTQAEQILATRRGIDAPPVLVRVHPDHLERGLEVADRGHAAAVYLPKADLVSVARCAALAEQIEQRRSDDDPTASVGRRPLPIVALIESARGLLDAPSLAAQARVIGLALGESDLYAELGLAPDLSDDERRSIRLQVVVASAAAGLRGPTAPASTDYQDLDRYRESCVALRRIGFAARSAVHPAQVAVINEVFAPDEDEVHRARQLVDAFEAATAAGRGVIVGEDGRMIDEAVVRSARRLLDCGTRRLQRPQQSSEHLRRQHGHVVVLVEDHVRPTLAFAATSCVRARVAVGRAVAEHQ
jgi:citrate lyase subunit beta / citryl-CoA lyase